MIDWGESDQGEGILGSERFRASNHGARYWGASDWGAIYLGASDRGVIEIKHTVRNE